MKNSFLFLLLLLSTVAISQKKIDNNTAKQLLKEKNMQLLDVRTKGEVSQGKIIGSMHIDYFKADFLQQCLSSLDKSKPLIVYCAAGGRSAKAAQQLKKNGFKVVYDLSGGFDNWE